MEKLPSEAEPVSSDVSNEFSKMAFSEFRRFLRQKIRENPAATFTIVVDQINASTPKQARALFDDSRLGPKIKSITIRATREQYEKDVNAFESGVKWEEVSSN